MMKKDIEEEKIYDNSFSSILLYKARTNTLPLQDRKRFTNENTICELCKKETENLEHFLLDCEQLSEERRIMIELQKPHIENRQVLMGKFLFGKENIQNKKIFLANYWKSRKKILESPTNI